MEMINAKFQGMVTSGEKGMIQGHIVFQLYLWCNAGFEKTKANVLRFNKIGGRCRVVN